MNAQALRPNEWPQNERTKAANERSTLNWLFIVIFSFLTKLALKFQTNPCILTLKWSAREPSFPVQQPRDFVRGTAINSFIQC